MMHVSRSVGVVAVVVALSFGLTWADEKPASAPAAPVAAEKAKKAEKAEKKEGDAAQAKAQAKPKAEASQPAKKDPPKTHTVKPEKFAVHLNLSGAFEAKDSHVIAVRPEAWQQFEVVKVAPHGKRVKKGEVILQFDTEKIDQAIDDHQTGAAISDLEYQAAQQELSMLEETIPLDIKLAERTKEYFDEDYERYQEVEVPLSRRIADESLKSYEQMLAYETEELKQLEKMYKADDLTEETEEIILQRQRNTVNRLKFSLERAKLSHERTLETLLPREKAQAEVNAKMAQLRVESARQNFPRMLAQKRLALQKQTREREKAVEQLKRMKRDRGRMTVKAPFDGIVYYGDSQRGQFNAVAQADAMLTPGNNVKPGQALLTVVSPKALQLRTTVSEAALRFAETGIKGKVTPTGFPDRRLDGKLAEVALVPLTPGNFDAVVTVETGDASTGGRIVPGMTGSVKLLAYENDKALTVPTSAVHSDDDGSRYVYVLGKNGKHEKRSIEAGKWTSAKTEVVKGLKEGEKVLLEKPEGE